MSKYSWIYIHLDDSIGVDDASSLWTNVSDIEGEFGSEISKDIERRTKAMNPNTRAPLVSHRLGIVWVDEGGVFTHHLLF